MWNLKGDMRYFKNLTTATRNPSRKNAVIMGRNTHEAIGRDLPGRINLVLGRRPGTLHDLPAALLLAASKCAETVFVIGGEDIYREALAHPHCVAVHVTEVICGEVTEPADRFFPALDVVVWEPWAADVEYTVENGVKYRHASFRRRGSRS